MFVNNFELFDSDIFIMKQNTIWSILLTPKLYQSLIAYCTAKIKRFVHSIIPQFI